MKTLVIKTAATTVIVIILLSALLTISINGCINRQEDDNNLVAKLYWNTGSLPPEYYYYYRIKVGPGTGGVFEYQPGYGEPPAPEVWKVDFEVSSEQMETLYCLIQENNLLKNQWAVSEETAEGASTSSLTIIYGGNEYNIPGEYRLETEERAKVSEVTDYLREMVPPDIWNEMGERQSQFEESFSNQ